MPGLTQYYFACSMDGFIAESDGGLEWLHAFPGAEDNSYREFFQHVGSIAVGRATYDLIVAESPDRWPYGSVPTWVFTSREARHPTPRESDVRFVNGDVASVQPQLVEAAGDKNVWVLGGGKLAAQFLAAGLLDEIIATFIPVTLGTGIPFLPFRELRPMPAVKATAFDNGTVEVSWKPAR